VRSFAGKPSTIRGRRSIRTAPTPYLRNALLPDGSPAVKEDVEGICSATRERTFTPDMASNGSRRWKRHRDYPQPASSAPFCHRGWRKCSLL